MYKTKIRKEKKTTTTKHHAELMVLDLGQGHTEYDLIRQIAGKLNLRTTNKNIVLIFILNNLIFFLDNGYTMNSVLIFVKIFRILCCNIDCVIFTREITR